MTMDTDDRVAAALRDLADEAVPSAGLRARALDGPAPTTRSPARLLAAAAVLVVVALAAFALQRDDAPEPTITTDEGPAPADQVVIDFLDAVRLGDLDTAARFVADYATVGFDGARTPRDATQRFTEQFPDLVDALSFEWFTTPLPAPAHGGGAIVTAVGTLAPGAPKRAAAFVVAGGERLLIQRLPRLTVSTPPSGSWVEPGDTIVLPDFPIEGDATAHVNGRDVPVAVDYEALTTTIEVPDWAEGEDELVVTAAFATPELPAAIAFWYRVGPEPEVGEVYEWVAVYGQDGGYSDRVRADFMAIAGTFIFEGPTRCFEGLGADLRNGLGDEPADVLGLVAATEEELQEAMGRFAGGDGPIHFGRYRSFCNH